MFEGPEKCAPCGGGCAPLCRGCVPCGGGRAPCAPCGGNVLSRLFRFRLLYKRESMQCRQQPGFIPKIRDYLTSLGLFVLIVRFIKEKCCEK